MLAVVVTALLVHQGSARECTAEDWEWQYTACAGGTRALVYYKSPSTDACSGGVAAPANVFGLPCDASCAAGTYLVPGTTACAGCAPGTYSRSGGVRVDAWGGFPAVAAAPGVRFESWGAPAASPETRLGAGAWAPADAGGLLLRSGAVNHSQASVLRLQTHLVAPGRVRFAFRADGEPGYDGLAFFVDGTPAMNVTSTAPALRTVAVALARGYHTLEWRYVKDASVSLGEDCAWLRVVELDGTGFADDRCTPCAPGSASAAPNASACDFCPRNTCAPDAGTTVCTPCPTDHYAPAGATACLPRTPCTSSDMYPVYGSCTPVTSSSSSSSSGSSSSNNGQGKSRFARTLEWRWLEDTTCDYANAELPAPTTVPCGPCNPGTYRDRTTGQCLDCPAGTVSSGIDYDSGSESTGSNGNNDFDKSSSTSNSQSGSPNSDFETEEEEEEAVGEETCVRCGDGQETQPGLYIRRWYRAEELPPTATGCTGECGTAGWVLAGDRATSGTGHGATVESFLELNFTTARATELRFVYTLVCARAWDCRLSVLDIGHSTTLCFAAQARADTVPLAPGAHTLRFLYSRSHSGAGPAPNVSADRAEILELDLPASFVEEEDEEDEIADEGNFEDRNNNQDNNGNNGSNTINNRKRKIRNGLGGTGGRVCRDCLAGTHARAGEAWCEACPAGSSSGARSTECALCAEDTYNDVAGGECRACGTNVHAPAGSAACDTSCAFSPAPGVTYDLSMLRRPTMYGPIYDSTLFSFYVNLCSRYNASASASGEEEENKDSAPCHDEEGNPIESFACQPFQGECAPGAVCADYDLGQRLDLVPLEGATRGFNLTYTGGTEGCDGAARSATVTLRCAPGGGLGVPGAWPNRTIEGPPCHYDILWESQYGCPLCTAADYTFVYGECRNNVRRKMYHWRTNPRACHDGVALPPDEDEPAQCAGEATCAPGHHYDAAAGACTPCTPGTYSPGAGYAHYRFDALPERFTTACGALGACTPFFAVAGRLRSGLGHSVLVYTSRFLVDGFVNFTYSLVSADGDGGGDDGNSNEETHRTRFVVTLDGAPVLGGDLVAGTGGMAVSEERSIAVPAGSHMLAFEFEAHSAQSFVEIERMLVYGDRAAPLYCPACPTGHAQPEAGAAQCVRCTEGTAPDDAHTQCAACEPAHYTLNGTACAPAPACTAANYAVLYTPCRNGMRTRRHVKLTPTAVCEGGYDPSQEDAAAVPEACEPCPVGTRRLSDSSASSDDDSSNSNEEEDECVGCPTGTYFDAETETCVAAREGHVAVGTATFFAEGTAGETQLPRGWRTFAALEAFPPSRTTAAGWRSTATGAVDCGPALSVGRYASVLEYTVTGAPADLTVRFDYAVADAALLRGTQLQFFANGHLYDYVVTATAGAADGVKDNKDEGAFVQSRVVTVPHADVVTLRWLATVAPSDATETDTEVSLAADIALRNVVVRGVPADVPGRVTAEEACPAGTDSDSAHARCVACAAGTSSAAPGAACAPCAAGTFAAVRGQHTCAPCRAGTAAEHTGATRCTTACVFRGARHTFNMSALAGRVFGPVAARTSSSGSSSGNSNRTFYLSVCDGTMRAGECNAAATASAPLHVCAPGPGATRIDYGSQLEFVDPSDAGTSEGEEEGKSSNSGGGNEEGGNGETTVVLRFHADSRTAADSNNVSAACAGREVVTTVFFQCRVGAGAGFPTLLPSDACAPAFAWASEYACRTCADGDYEEALSRCARGTQRRERYRRAGAACHGPARVLVAEEACTDVRVSLGVVAGVAAVVLALGGVIAYFVWKNRAMTIKYTKLLQSQDGDLEAMADADADAERARRDTATTATL